MAEAAVPRKWKATAMPLLLLLLAIVCFIHGSTQAQAAVTDANEAMALNSIFMKWNISSTMTKYKWNTSDDVCSGVALENEGSVDNIYNDDNLFNPGIICDCSFENNTLCHITRLKAYNLNITGRLPVELWSLTYLNNLLIGRNYFTGPLPAYIGNLTMMKWLSLGFNALSGELPKELGNLSNLKSLGIGLNNFTGKIPPELGNITGLEQMYMDSIGVTGGIPSSFANFKNLKYMWAADNNFGEKLPDFIGNLTSLQSVRLQGNSFQGPIPFSFSNLVSLTELRLSNLLNGSSSLSFVENMTHLSSLILRDNGISGPIPSSIGTFQNLTYLDLSFNNLSGLLPQSVFSLPLLGSLYLGNNSFTGSLPTQLGPQLLIIDLSYNNLSGSLPSWTASRNNLQLNLVANNFDSNSGLPWGLDCIQKGFPCYRGSPAYSSFAINCGGNELKLPDGTIYESDKENITMASYFVKNDLRWALSNVGTYYEAPNPQYIATISSNILKTSNQELFQSVRTSASSIRYYGLAMENGNYTVTLDFAEIAFLDIQTWESFGKRIFDIYIQGILAAKDFDIRKEAGGRSFTAITRNYTTLVTANFLEIHLFWAGKGTCCIPTQGYYGPLISAIRVIPNFTPTVPNHLPKKKNSALVPGIAAGTAAALLSLLVLGFFIWRRRTRPEEDEDLRGLPNQPYYFSFAELKTATNNFNTANKLGEGGFGSVFKAKLTDGRLVAVKQLSASVQGKKQFITEVATISSIQHRNLVKLYGCCYEGTNRLLVYEYMENNSVEHALFERSVHLDWRARCDICLGTARGLAYLHEESSIRIVHRDIKASNILLDSNLSPKISDFGLAKLFEDGMTHIVTRIAGTIGYLAPEYAMRGLLTEKVDTYGFGIVVLEILSGRRNVESALDGGKIYLLEWAWQLFEQNQFLEILDPTLPSFNQEEALCMIKVAFLCTQINPTLRPAMSRVVAMLGGTAEISNDIKKPSYLPEWDADNGSISNLYSLSTATGGPLSAAVNPNATSVSTSVNTSSADSR